MHQSQLHFARRPTSHDFAELSEYIEQADRERMAPSLWRQRHCVTARLIEMSREPDEAENIAAYHALRLLVW